MWEYDLGKCIDATPIVENGSIFLGSHSGRFVSLSLDGTKEWEVQFDDRIEATACYQNGIIAVGNKCLFGSYDKCLYLVDIKNQMMLWKIVCDGSILSSPMLVGTIVLCATLRGEFLSVELETGTILWKIQLAAPIFANLCIIKEHNHVLVANVKGLITLCDTRNGRIIYQYDVLECIFAAPVQFPDDTNSSNVSIIVTHSSSLFLLQTDTLQLLWYIRINGVGSFPRPPEILNNEGYLFIQDSSGALLAIKGLRDIMKKNTIDLKISRMKIIEVLRVPGETFSGVQILKINKRDSNKSNDSSSSKSDSSSSSGSKMTIVSYRALIGSRDDRIRCFQFSF
ncbi:unnamed protein product [Wuchereria bancrofti]|uniref:Pyrrolo-quinoline quinone repeat domain-containing protein n=1 Tax=Wuchereria bancrofti TaxID=6293 RepID=A0A3P7DY15_WUCBA|nr:unnamed protein product [Wuchereria bancrofti]